MLDGSVETSSFSEFCQSFVRVQYNIPVEKESRYVIIANTMFRVLKYARIPLFLNKSTTYSQYGSISSY